MSIYNLPEHDAIIPADRSIKQPTTAFCRNPQCREVSHREFVFQVEHERFCCPKCGADREPMIGLLVLTHLLIPKKGGPIRGAGGVPFAFACDAPRAYLATATNQEAASDNALVVNCPGCRKAIDKLGVKQPTGQEMVLGNKE